MAIQDCIVFSPHTARCTFYEYEFEYIYHGIDVELLLCPPSRPLDTVNLLECYHLAELAIQPFIQTCVALDILRSSFQSKNPDDLKAVYKVAMAALVQPYWEIDEMLPAATKRLRALVEKIKINASLQIGFVYLMKYQNGVYKIGMSIQPENRLNTLSTASPQPLALECIIHSDDMAWLENELHTRFDHKRIRNEWFKLSPSDVQFFHALAGGKTFQEAEAIAYQTIVSMPMFDQK